MKKIILGGMSAAFVLAMMAGLAVAGMFLWYHQSAAPLPEPTNVVIEPGTGFSLIAKQLEQEKVIGNALLFRAMVMLEGRHAQFKAGEYAFSPQMTPKMVADLLVKGESITHAITIPEGKTSAEIRAILMQDDRLTGLITEEIPEGSLLPDTHHVHRGDSRQSVIARMEKAQKTLMGELWPQRRPDLPVKTPEEALILASIIEKETGVDGERRRVASVFVNRLKKGMKLQSDPTVVYAIERAKGAMNRPLYRKDWEFNSPYNTYQVVGLPPAPICHPGEEAIKAALNPATEDYLFFVATGKGGHYFAKTLREHNRNIARYKRELRAR